MKNTRQIMYYSNSKIRKYLKGNNFKIKYVAPHIRHSKDIVLDEVGFDAICAKIYETGLYFAQWKTHCRPSKKILQRFKELEKKYEVRCIWCNVEKKTTTTKKGEVKIYYAG